MYNEEYFPNYNDSENYLQNQSDISIYRKDLITIENPSEWDPPDEVILAYAKQLKFDVDNDPPELLAIAKKYLKMPPPKNITRAILKETLDILYIDESTEEVYRKIELDNLCINEYEKEKEKIENEKNKKKKKKGKKKKKKKSNRDSSANEDEKVIKKLTEEDKKNLIEKIKEKFKEKKYKLKLNYIKNKTKSIKNIQDEYEEKRFEEKNKLKLELNDKIIKQTETKLKK